ncbi:MAG: hypothetical protein RL017_63 [Pseudomonadota bacterium]|jgi:hypothetical protein
MNFTIKWAIAQQIIKKLSHPILQFANKDMTKNKIKSIDMVI